MKTSFYIVLGTTSLESMIPAYSTTHLTSEYFN